MRSPFLYIRNILGMTCRKIRYGSRLSAGFVQTFDHLHTEIYNKGSISIGGCCQNRGNLYLVSDGGRLCIGSHCFFNTGCCITAMEMVTVGDYCKFGNNLVIVDHDHNFREGNAAGENKNVKEYISAPVTIGDHTWVGADVVILKGTKIGRNCVIGAGSIVKGCIPDNSIYIDKRNSTVYENSQNIGDSTGL